MANPQINPKAPKPKSQDKTILGLKPLWFYIIIGTIITIFLLIVVLLASKASKKDEAPPPQVMTEQVAQVPEPEVQSHGLDADLINYMDEKNASMPNFWAIEHKNTDGTTLDPFLLLANQATEVIIQKHANFSSVPVGIKTANGTVIAIDDTNPQAKNVYETGVASLRNIIAQSYDFEVAEILVNNGLNKANGIIVKDKATGEPLNTLDKFQSFEQWVMVEANANTLLIVDSLLALAPSAEELEAQNAPSAEQQAMIDNEKMKAVIDTLNNNLEQARRENEQKAQEINRMTEQMQSQDKKMAQFLQQLENKPEINQKLRYSTLAKQAPYLDTTAVIGDRIYMQDKAGVQYSAKVGDVIELKDGKRLVLTNADTQEVIIE